jgi:hypothetical protein
MDASASLSAAWIGVLFSLGTRLFATTNLSTGRYRRHLVRDRQHDDAAGPPHRDSADKWQGSNRWRHWGFQFRDHCRIVRPGRRYVFRDRQFAQSSF